MSNNTSGSTRNHTFDVRINDGNQNDSTLYVRDTLTISQNVNVVPLIYEYGNFTHSQKTGLVFYRNNGSFHTATFKSNTQGNNTNDNVLRMTVTPTGIHASEITSVQYYLSPITGDYSNPHFLLNSTTMTQVHGQMFQVFQEVGHLI